MAIVLGLNGKAYRNTATWGSPSWTLVSNIRDVTQNLETGEADVTDRSGGGWRQTAATLKDGTVEFEMLWDTSDANFTAIQAAWENSTTIEMVFLDGVITDAGNEGLRADFSVTNFSRSEALEEAMTISVTLKPSNTANTPTWYTSTT